jgi:hypothetical protein
VVADAGLDPCFPELLDGFRTPDGWRALEEQDSVCGIKQAGLPRTSVGRIVARTSSNDALRILFSIKRLSKEIGIGKRKPIAELMSEIRG